MIERLVLRLAADDISAVLVTHDVAQAKRVADHVVVLDAGRVVTTGGVEILDQPDLARLVSY